MFSWYKNYKQKQANLEAEKRAQMLVELRQMLAHEETQKLAADVEYRAEFIKQKQASDIPWFEIIAVDDNGIPKEMLWNAAYIKQLNDAGFNGKTDNETLKLFHENELKLKNEKILADERELKHDSSEPWVEVIGETVTSDGQIALKLDWNRAFIKYLKKSGIKGTDEDDIVEKWLTTLNTKTILDTPERYE